jgi:Transposase DDE domain
MPPTEVAGWVLTIAAGLRLSQAKTLADLVTAAARVSRGTLSALGRCLPGPTAAKHRIKRAWRFCANDRVHASEVMPRVIRRLARNRKKPLLVALDWTDVGRFHTLMAAAVMRGRAVPLLWASYADGQLTRSRNSFEESLLRLLVTMPPGGVRVILLADRGFGRTELANTCRDLRLRFLIRIKPDVRVAHPSYTGRLDDYPVRKGMWRVLAGAEYRSDRAATLNVVIRWKHGLPPKRDGPWFLMTDLPGSAVRLTGLYARRTAVEELFRDAKGTRYGLGPGEARVGTPARLDRLILVLALAIILLVGVGPVARRQYRPGAWGSSNDPTECRDVTVGRRMWDRIAVPPERLLDEVVRATLASVQNWG